MKLVTVTVIMTSYQVPSIQYQATHFQIFKLPNWPIFKLNNTILIHCVPGTPFHLAILQFNNGKMEYWKGGVYNFHILKFSN